ncbi:hypothetical protein V8E53_015223 [Lactarius tabidus]
MGSGTEKTRLTLVTDIDDQLGAKSKVKRLLAVLSAGSASGPSSRAGRTEAGAPNIGRSSARLVTGLLVTMAPGWSLVWSASMRSCGRIIGVVRPTILIVVRTGPRRKQLVKNV